MTSLSDLRVTLATALILGAAACAVILPPPAEAASVASAGRAARAADHAVVKRARQLTGCQRSRRKSCAAPQRALQRAGHRLRATDLRLRALGRLALYGGKARRPPGPRLRAAGHRLRWTGRALGLGYVLMRKPTGQPAVYSVTRRTAVTPPALPGFTVAYRVRRAVAGSRWSAKREITYPSPSDAPSPAAPSQPPAPAAKRTDAPAVKASGRTISWNRVAGIDDYVLVAKVRGGEHRYSVVRGTSATPPIVAGKSVRYTVRTMVVGSAWAVDTPIDYAGGAGGPQAAAPPPPPPPSAPADDAPLGFEAGVVSGSNLKNELPFLRDLGARTARTEFDSATPVSAMASDIEAFAKAGVRPLILAGFNGRLPTAAEAANVATWAAAFGPGGTFWAGKSYPRSVAPVHIEFGNETSFSWQYSQISGDSNWANTPFYKSMAQNYAIRFKAASEAIKLANPRVDLLAVGEAPGRWGVWMDSLFGAVPDFANYVGGWTIHPYGPTWRERIDDTLREAAEHGASDAIPFYATEVGISSDNGRCLSDNYGWDPCMTYDQAGSALTGEIDGIRATYGARVKGIWFYVAHDQQNQGASTDREAYFGALTLKRTAKGGYTSAVKAVLAAP